MTTGSGQTMVSPIQHKAVLSLSRRSVLFLKSAADSRQNRAGAVEGSAGADVRWLARRAVLLAGRHIGAALLALTAVTPVYAQVQTPPARLVHLNAQAEQRLPHDWVAVTLAVRHQGDEAAAVQAHLQRVLQRALEPLRARQRPGELEVASGAVQVQPRYGREGQIVGWQGSAELLVQGRDVGAITALAAQTPGMVVAGLQTSVSREAARAAEADLRAQAIAAFRQQAQDVAAAFGFRGYVLHEVHVGAQRPEPGPIPVMRGMAAAVEAAPALPVAPGHTWLQVTVSGAVQLQ